MSVGRRKFPVQSLEASVHFCAGTGSDCVWVLKQNDRVVPVEDTQRVARVWAWFFSENDNGSASLIQTWIQPGTKTVPAVANEMVRPLLLQYGSVIGRLILMDEQAPVPPTDRQLHLGKECKIPGDVLIPGHVLIGQYLFDRGDIVRHSSVLADSLDCQDPERKKVWVGQPKVAVDFFHALVSGGWYTKALSYPNLVACTKLAHEMKCALVLGDCERLLCREVNAQNVFNLYDLARTHGLARVADKCRSFIVSSKGAAAMAAQLDDDADRLFALVRAAKKGRDTVGSPPRDSGPPRAEGEVSQPSTTGQDKNDTRIKNKPERKVDTATARGVTVDHDPE